jgi:hypothetical protein
MAISYPLSLPTTIGIANITLTASNAVAISESPFTYRQQIVAHPGQRWSATVSVPPLRKEFIEPWVTTLLALKGQVGTFLLGDPNNATPRGVATGTPLVKGAGQTGGTLEIDGATPSVTGWLLAGDYIQLGSGASATLHKVLQSANSDSGGNVTLEIWPNIRTAPLDNAVVTLNNTVGLFRLATNQQSWSINESSAYGLSFDCVEVIV